MKENEWKGQKVVNQLSKGSKMIWGPLKQFERPSHSFLSINNSSFYLLDNKHS